MKYKYFTIILFLLFIAGSLPVVNAQESGTVFFKITGQNKQPSYIMGVMPYHDPAFYNLTDTFYSAVNGVKKIATEEILDTAQQRIFKEKMQLPDNRTFLSYVNNMKFGIIDELFVKNESTAWRYNEFQPLYIRKKLEETNKGPRSLENFLIVLAEEQGKEYVPVLTPEELSRIYVTVPIPLQADILVEYGQKMQQWNKDKKQLKEWYLQGDLQALLEYEKSTSHIEYFKQINRAKAGMIANEIAGISNTGSTFYLMDVFLLPGQDGLLQKLISEGFTVTPMKAFTTQKSLLPLSAMLTEKTSKKGEVQYYDLNLEHKEDYFTTTIPDWNTTISQSGAFAIRMPEEPQLLVERVPAEDGFLNVYMYRFEDKAINTFYLVSYNDYPPAFKPESRKDFFRDVIGSVIRRMGGSLLMEKDISTTQYRAKEIEVEVDQDYFVRARFYLINNRLYQVIVGGSDKRAYSPENEAYLRSFKLIDQQMEEWEELNIGVAKILFPETPERKEKHQRTAVGMVSSFDYILADNTTNLEYLMNYTLYPDTYQVKDLDNFYNSIIYNVNTTINGVLIKDEEVRINGTKGRSIMIGSGTSTIYRILMVYWKNRLVQVMVKGNEDSANSEYAEKYLNSFRLDNYEY